MEPVGIADEEPPPPRRAAVTGRAGGAGGTTAAGGACVGVRDRQGRFSGWSKGKAALDARIAANRAKAAGRAKAAAEDAMAPWRLHDLRRSVVTHMAEIGIQPHVIEAVVNHISGHKGGVAGVYNRATYAVEKRGALDRWADWLLGLMPGEEVAMLDGNVVPMSSRRAAS